MQYILLQWYSSLLRNKFKLSLEMKNILKKLISKKDSNLEKVRKIYYYITNEIRYVGFELGIGGIKPRSSDLTFKSKMGDCKDVSVLLVAILKHLGIESNLALIRTRDKGQANFSVPFLGNFNHAICYVNLENGFFLDGTVERSSLKEIPDSINNIDALVIKNFSVPSSYKFINTKNNFYIIYHFSKSHFF